MPRADFYWWRMFATGASFVLFGAGGIVLGYVVFPLVSLVSSSQDVARLRCRKLVQLSFKAFVWFMKTLGVLTWEVQGRETLKREGQLVVANHPSLIDIVFLIAMIPNASCIVKSGLHRNFFTRGPVSMAAYVANDEPEKLVQECVKTLASGTTLVIFPEGSRSVKGRMLRFRRGAAYVQLEARGPVALVVIHSTPPTLAKHEKWYQIPNRRPHFTLRVETDEQNFSETLYDSAAISSRALTRRWRDYFDKEVVI